MIISPSHAALPVNWEPQKRRPSAIPLTQMWTSISYGDAVISVYCDTRTLIDTTTIALRSTIQISRLQTWLYGRIIVHKPNWRLAEIGDYN